MKTDFYEGMNKQKNVKILQTKKNQITMKQLDKIKVSGIPNFAKKKGSLFQMVNSTDLCKHT